MAYLDIGFYVLISISCVLSHMMLIIMVYSFHNWFSGYLCLPAHIVGTWVVPEYTSPVELLESTVTASASADLLCILSRMGSSAPSAAACELMQGTDDQADEDSSHFHCTALHELW